MSNVGISEAYPSDQYIVDQKHTEVDKDVYEALLDSHDFFGFGSNHDGGSNESVISNAAQCRSVLPSCK